MMFFMQIGPARRVADEALDGEILDHVIAFESGRTYSFVQPALARAREPAHAMARLISPVPDPVDHDAYRLLDVAIGSGRSRIDRASAIANGCCIDALPRPLRS